jgi:spore coat polysaccharide biosynthesis protein SpsF
MAKRINYHMRIIREMNCTVFVTARTASTRLPKKALLEINHKPLIKILLDRIQICKCVKNIIVCTTKDKSDDKLTGFIKKNNIEVFRGDNKDILNRLYKAAKKYAVEQFVVVEGDDVFCEPQLIDKTCRELSKSRYDFLHWEDLPFGVSPLGIKTKKLEKLIHAKRTRDTETGWGKFIIDSGFFRVGKLRSQNKKWTRPEIRLSVDYPEDLELVKRIYEKLPSHFSLTNIIALLDKNPKWQGINESVKEKYRQNFEKKMTKIALNDRREDQ